MLHAMVHAMRCALPDERREGDGKRQEVGSLTAHSTQVTLGGLRGLDPGGELEVRND